MAKVEFYVDGTLKGTDTTGDVNHNYTYSFDPSAYGIGQHAIVAKAYDAAGNVTTSSTVTLKVPDAVAPTAIVSSPVSGATISGTATLAANATDNVAVSKVDFYVDGALKGTDTTGTSNAYSISLDTTALSNASHSAVAKSYDAAGNVTTSSSINFIVNNVVTPPADSTPPTVVLTLPTGTLAGTVTLGATANDPSGIAKVEFYVDGVLKNTDTTAPYSYSLDTKTLTNAAHSIKATAYDKATPANSASSQTLNVAINNVSYLTADINQDGIVDIQDFGLLKVKFGSAGTGLGRADINQDGIVDIQDFGLLKVKFGQGVQ